MVEANKCHYQLRVGSSMNMWKGDNSAGAVHNSREVRRLNARDAAEAERALFESAAMNSVHGPILLSPSNNGNIGGRYAMSNPPKYPLQRGPQMCPYTETNSGHAQRPPPPERTYWVLSL